MSPHLFVSSIFPFQPQTFPVPEVCFRTIYKKVLYFVKCIDYSFQKEEEEDEEEEEEEESLCFVNIALTEYSPIMHDRQTCFRRQ